MGQTSSCSVRCNRCFLFYLAAQNRPGVRTGSLGVPLRQVASGTDSDARLHGSGELADPFATNHEDSGHPTPGTVGTILVAGLLRSSFVLLRRSHAAGERVHAKWVATIRAID